MQLFKSASYLVAVIAFVVAPNVSAVGLPNVSNVHQGKVLPETGEFSSAFTTGKPDVWLRLRYEDVEDDIPAGSPLAGTEDAELLSLRAALGYTTARFHGFWARLELEASRRLNSDEALNVDEDLTFPPGPAGSRIAEGHALIPDNNFEEINEAYIGWRSASGGCPNAPGACNGHTSFKLGRQAIIYDNHRWVGNIIWRQNLQSYDAFRIDNSSISNLSISYAYLNRVNRLFGDDSAFREYEMNNSHLINVAYQLPIGKLTGYGYLLDYDDNTRTPFPEGVGVGPGITNFDSDTWGLRFVGKHPVGDGFTLLTELEWANQDPSGDAVSALDDNDYINIEIGGAFEVAGKPVVVKLGHEVLEGNGINALQTPLATVHAFNGWSDKFVGAPGGSATPAGGLKDTSATVVVKGLLAGLIGPSKLVFQYHDYEADKAVAGINDYGDEWGLLFAKPFTKQWLGLVKYASFDDGGDGFSIDTDKFWLLAQYRLK
ncbi:MAG: alginate export family protein [Candidatus Thiodiazotropha sp. (ex Codakia rugifera)]|nr:alginate export family protein [Candidatus Thiodiazotropha sp. (ex Codakia rugifera)]